jgi:hypothetical protein
MDYNLEIQSFVDCFAESFDVRSDILLIILLYVFLESKDCFVAHESETFEFVVHILGSAHIINIACTFPSPKTLIPGSCFAQLS